MRREPPAATADVAEGATRECALGEGAVGEVAFGMQAEAGMQVEDGMQVEAGMQVEVGMQAARRALGEAILPLCPRDGRFPLGNTGAHVVRFSATTKEMVRSTPRPVLCIVAQGEKTIFLGKQAMLYDASRLLVLSVEVPVSAQVTQASAAEPYLSLVLDLQPEKLSQLVLRVFPNGVPRSKAAAQGVFLAPSQPAILDAATRLVRLMATPEDVPLLAPLLIEEILLRLLLSPIGPRLAQGGLSDSKLQRISRSIAWLRANYAQPIRMAELAELANMSLSSFHHQFKALTTVSPLHFQKALRLQEARRCMLLQGMDAASAALQVGYLSASQFSREYTRFFGFSPTKDIARLLKKGLSADDVIR